ncbi:MAG TPA: ArsA-related P-loop ATPase [Miltoncostaeaceae bacterium]|nr:ArsA-related P-loop ATPase [Miltoncostaeaceae bacterium]
MSRAAAGPAPPLIERRLWFVLGKGGSGKSTVSATLGLTAALAGRRTLLMEVAGQNRVSAIFAGASVGHERPVELRPGLFGLSVMAEQAMEEYLTGQLRMRPLVEVLSRSRAFHHFVAAAPGLAEIVTLGKIWSLATELEPDGSKPVWDALVVDAPATGHALALLDAAGRIAQIATGGPIHEQAERIEAVIQHPAATGIVVVARPEELAVSEALDAAAELAERELPAALAVLNAMHTPRFSAGDDAALEAALGAGPLPPAERAALEAAHARRVRELDEQGLLERLRDGVGLPVLELPCLIARQIDLPALEGVAEDLARERPPALFGAT